AGPAGSSPALSVVLPVPGDVRGLPAGTQFQRDALSAGEAVLVAGRDPATSVGLVPDFEYEDADDEGNSMLDPALCALSWMVYSIPGAPVTGGPDLGEAEFALRSAVRSAADTFGALRAGLGGADVADPRGLVEQILDSARAHRIPDHAPPRA